MKAVRLIGVLALAAACGDDAPETAVITTLSAEHPRASELSYSPDGKHVAFFRPGPSGYHLWVAAPDLSNARQFDAFTTLEGATPAWSTDSRAIAIAASMRGLADVALVSLSDGAVTWLTESPALEIPLQFHPDGDRVVYAAYASGGTVAGFTVTRAGEVRPLVKGVERPYLGIVSPDGQRVAYMVLDQGRSTIWMADSGDVVGRQVTTEGFEELAGLGGPGGWSPDGRELLYVSRRTGKRDVWVADADGSTRRLTSDINDDFDPAWSPDSRWVAFLSDRGRQRDLWVVPAEGGEARRVTDDPTEEVRASWTGPDRLAYLASESPGALWRVPLGGGAEERLTDDSLDAGAVWMSPDRSQLAIRVDHPGGSSDLVVMSAGGDSMRAISTGATHDQVHWDPTSSRIAYAADRNGSLDVWVASVDGVADSARRLTTWAGFEVPEGWTADGRMVEVLADHQTRLSDLWHVPASGGEPQRTTQLGAVMGATSYTAADRRITLLGHAGTETGELMLSELRPDGTLRPVLSGNVVGVIVSDDGGTLAAIATRNGETGAVVFRLDGTVLHTLGRATTPHDFSPDGRSLLFGVSNEESADLALLELETGTRRDLPQTPGDETVGYFSADGSSVLARRSQVTTQVKVAHVAPLLRDAP